MPGYQWGTKLCGATDAPMTSCLSTHACGSPSVRGLTRRLRVQVGSGAGHVAAPVRPRRTLGGDLLGAGVDRGCRYVQGGGELGDVGEGDVALASLDAAVVAAAEAALERESFLGDVALQVQLAQCLSESGVDGREL